MKVLLIGLGESYTVGTFFANGLKSLGVDHIAIDLRRYYKFQGYSIIDRFSYRVFGSRLNTFLFLNKEIVAAARQIRPDIVIVIKGSNILPRTLIKLKKYYGSKLINFATDDPFSPHIQTKNLIESIPLYDLYVCTKRAIINDIENAGGSNVVYLPFAYEPSLHYPASHITLKEREQFTNDIVFIGGGDSYRRKIIAILSKIPSINIHLYGGYWNTYPESKKFYHGYAIDHEFRLAYSLSKISPGLIRHSNRDGHSMRSFEIPACGAFLLAEGTEEHKELFREDQDAVFFYSVDELVNKVNFYKNHEALRRKIAMQGYERITNGQNTYLDRLKSILKYSENI